MEFGTSYIFLFGLKIFEPNVILSNLLIFLVCLYYFKNLNVFEGKYAKQTSVFVLFMGISTCFASVGHAVHLQLGEIFFRIIVFMSHSFNIIALYFCFKAAYTYTSINKQSNAYIGYSAIGVTVALMIVALITGSFLTIKIPAGIVLVYSLIVHFIGYRKNERGSGLFVSGVLIAFLSILIHTFRLSLNEWCNHKDLAHIAIAASLTFMCMGVKINSQNAPALSLAN